jgi:hypothetical protein
MWKRIAASAFCSRYSMWLKPLVRGVVPAISFGNGAPSRRPRAPVIGSSDFSIFWSKASTSSSIDTATVIRR